jgi:hypothetical protein
MSDRPAPLLPPELDPDHFLSSVLLLSGGESEDTIEDELISRATALGISTRRPLSLNAADDDSAAGSFASSSVSVKAPSDSTQHSRTLSTQTDDTEHSLDSGLATGGLSSWDTDSGGDDDGGGGGGGHGANDAGHDMAAIARVFVRPVNFEPYRQMIEKVDPTAIGQQKIARDQDAPGPPHSALARLGLGTRRNCSNMKKRGLKALGLVHHKAAPTGPEIK